MIDTTPFKVLYPFNSNWLDLDGIRYHYLDEGPRDASPLVMLHGNPTWSFYYRNLIPTLSKTHRVIVPDHIGCGLSDKPQVYPYTLNQHVQNLKTLMEHLALKHVRLMVHDWGGIIGMGYAIDHPENIDSFVIFNTTAFYLRKLPILIRICRSNLLGSFIVRRLNAFARLATILAMSNRKQMTAQVRVGYLAPYNNWHNRIGIHRFVQDIPWEDKHLTRNTLMRIDAGLEHFRNHPMIIIWGADDFVFTERDFLAGWQQRFPDAKIHVLQNAGHYVVEDAYEQIIPLVLDFLS